MSSKVAITCLQCKEDFLIYPSKLVDPNYGPRKYCSMTCKGLAARVKVRACKVCGKPVSLRARLYCSHKCAQVPRTQAHMAARRVCAAPGCGKRVKKASERKYCSAKCFGVVHAKRRERERRFCQHTPCWKRVKAYDRKFCSIDCYRADQKLGSKSNLGRVNDGGQREQLRQLQYVLQDAGDRRTAEQESERMVLELFDRQRL